MPRHRPRLPWLCSGCGAGYYGETAASGCCPDGEALRTPSGRSHDREAQDMRDQAERMYRQQGLTSAGRRP